MFIAHAYWTEQTLIENNATSEDFSINITVILLQCLPCCKANVLYVVINYSRWKIIY